MYFENISTKEELKKEYRRLAKKLHPDHGGNEEEFKKMLSEYESIQLKGFKKAAKETNVNLDPATEAVLKRVIHLDINIEVVGSWIWVDGNTYKYRKALKELGFLWASKRKKWFFRSEENKTTRSKNKSFDEIKAKYGASKIANRATAALNF